MVRKRLGQDLSDWHVVYIPVDTREEFIQSTAETRDYCCEECGANIFDRPLFVSCLSAKHRPEQQVFQRRNAELLCGACGDAEGVLVPFPDDEARLEELQDEFPAEDETDGGDGFDASLYMDTGDDDDSHQFSSRRRSSGSEFRGVAAEKSPNKTDRGAIHSDRLDFPRGDAEFEAIAPASGNDAPRELEVSRRAAIRRAFGTISGGGRIQRLLRVLANILIISAMLAASGYAVATLVDVQGVVSQVF